MNPAETVKRERDRERDRDHVERENCNNMILTSVFVKLSKDVFVFSGQLYSKFSFREVYRHNYIRWEI